jgi:hypothetical protein
MRRRTAVLTLVLLAANSSIAFAADASQATDPAPIQTAVSRAAKDSDPSVELSRLSQTPGRPAALPALYGTYGVLQAMDVISTRKAIAAGSRETNPLTNAGSLGTLVAVKAIGGATTMYFAEKAWKKNRVGAIVLMTALNGATAAVVAHNVRNARR